MEDWSKELEQCFHTADVVGVVVAAAHSAIHSTNCWKAFQWKEAPQLLLPQAPSFVDAAAAAVRQMEAVVERRTWCLAIAAAATRIVAGVAVAAAAATVGAGVVPHTARAVVVECWHEPPLEGVAGGEVEGCHCYP